MGNCSGKRTFEVHNPAGKSDISGSKYVRKDSFSFDEINVGATLRSGKQPRPSEEDETSSPPHYRESISRQVLSLFNKS